VVVQDSFEPNAAASWHSITAAGTFTPSSEQQQAGEPAAAAAGRPQSQQQQQQAGCQAHSKYSSSMHMHTHSLQQQKDWGLHHKSQQVVVLCIQCCTAPHIGSTAGLAC
jgi:hypothetical protein